MVPPDQSLPAQPPPVGLGKLLFGLNTSVSQKAYVAFGFGLMLFKYAVDAGAIYAATGATWTPIDYLNPLFDERGRKIGPAPDWFAFVMALWTMPFIWIGATMTMRRAIDAGRSGWWGLAFFVPFLNYVVMLWLCLQPHRTNPRWDAVRPEVHGPGGAERLKSALLSVALGVALVLVMTVFAVYVNEAYGPMLFLGLPFLLGVTSGFVHNHRRRRPLGGTLLVALTALLISSGALLLFALEGIVCVLMCLGVAVPLVLAGAVIGWALASRGMPRLYDLTLPILAFPLMAVYARTWTEVETFEVISTIEIDAAPEEVWRNVVSFSELPPPEHWLFRTGVAYPIRARIAGTGVGAVRRCEFSTGAFVEPITRWEEPTRLSFDVVAQPDPMREWSFYSEIHPPHLDDSFRSLRGEFRLVALPGGRTRLEGSTWYALDIHPTWYWRLFTEPFLHTIHLRVLEHVKRLSEE